MGSTIPSVSALAALAMVAHGDYHLLRVLESNASVAWRHVIHHCEMCGATDVAGLVFDFRNLHLVCGKCLTEWEDDEDMHTVRFGENEP